ncbi:MAG: VWA domain-containing protein, partial [Bacteroidota bacterium]
MFLQFFFLLKSNGIPVSLHEYLHLMEALKKEVIGYRVEDFYALCKTIFIKQETQLDRFDQLFGQYFKGLESITDDVLAAKIPKDWLEKDWIRNLSEEEKAMIEKMGGLDELMKRFRELMEEQKERHQGGNKWIGTGGTSPFGAHGQNPEGFRMGQQGSGQRSAIKVWDQRAFKNLDDKIELNTRNIKMILKRLRH